jgi:TrmH family RNA methyltransferase
VLAVGNESRGLSAGTLRQAAIRFHIPVSPTVDSLNVAASAAIAAFYFSGLPKEGGKGEKSGKG